MALKITKQQLKGTAIKLGKDLFTIRGAISLTAIGIWIIVLQNFGIIPVNHDTQGVYVLNTVDVRGDVDANVHGNVRVDNTVDINLKEINGYQNCFYNHYKRHPKDYYRIPIDL
ncbi:MAG: hypothetical protein ACI4TR_04155 [Bacteroidaceae bacterium]